MIFLIENIAFLTGLAADFPANVAFAWHTLPQIPNPFAGISTGVFDFFHTIVPTGKNDPTWFDNPAITREMLPATIETLLMTVISTLFTVIFGLPIGLLLVATNKSGLFANAPTNKILGFIVNLGRSLPFLLLAVFIVPFTRMMAGTSLGWKAACVPLIVGATPFFARLVESNIMGVDAGKVEAAKMMGASRAQIMWGVQVREALPALVQSITVLVITIIGYSAITGAFGGGGLGALAINYGYNRYQGDTMLVSLIVIGVIVIVFQAVGDWLARVVDHR